MDVCSFVYRWFDCLGKLVVLESGENPTLPVYGKLILYKPVNIVPDVSAVKIWGDDDVFKWFAIAQMTEPSSTQPTADPSTQAGIAPPAQELATFNNQAGTASPVSANTDISSASGYTVKGTLFDDGSITDSLDADPTGNVKGNLIGFVGIDSKVYNSSGKPFINNVSRDGQFAIYQTRISSQGTVGVEAARITDENYLLRGRTPVLVCTLGFSLSSIIFFGIMGGEE